MAYSDEATTGHIYRLHSRWIRDVIDGGGSLLLGETPVWTEETIEEVVECFIGQPDSTPGKSFRDKLRDQMEGASPTAVQLMAEVLIVHFLHIREGAILPKTKVAQIETVLSWMPHPTSVPEDVIQALGPGLIHPGQYALARRDVQLTWIINFARAWVQLPPERRHELLDDPWEFRAFAEGIGPESGVNAAVAMTHMTHPDTFESIVSLNHKEAIVSRFAELVDGETDLDRQLLAIRGQMEGDQGLSLNWYTNGDLWLRWHKDQKKWRSFLTWAQRFHSLPNFDEQEREYKLGLAKKLSAVRSNCLDNTDGWAAGLKTVVTDPTNNLTSWRAHGKLAGWVLEDPIAARSALLALWGGEEDVATRFGQFVSLVPEDVLGTIGERLDIGSVLLMAEDPLNYPPFKISVLRKGWKLLGWPSDNDDSLSSGETYTRAVLALDEILFESKAWNEPLRDRLDAQSVLWSTISWGQKPDSFDTTTWDDLLAYRKTGGSIDEPEPKPEVAPDESDNDPDETDYISLAAKELCVERDVLDDIVELLDDKGQVVLYGPPGTGKTFLALRLARAIVSGDEDRVGLVQFHPATTYEDFIEGLRPTVSEAGQVGYELVPGPLVRIAEQARANPDQKHVLVIDELNRANLPKVFGELLLLLEHRSESAQLIHRPGEPFSLPLNLWIIGTMNTADRSIALIDAALRRRFHFVGFFPHIGPMRNLLRSWLDHNGGRAGVADFLEAINEELVETVGEHLLIGPSHFMKTDLSDRALRRIWEHNVFPLLEELFWGDRSAIDQWRWKVVRVRHAAALAGKGSVENPAGEESAPSPVPDGADGELDINGA